MKDKTASVKRHYTSRSPTCLAPSQERNRVAKLSLTGGQTSDHSTQPGELDLDLCVGSRPDPRLRLPKWLRS